MKNSFVSILIFVLSLLIFSSGISAKKSKYMELTWEDLIPEGYSQEAIYKKFFNKIATIQDGTEEGVKAYLELAEILKNAPVNKKLANRNIQISGYVAPLSINNEKVNEILLVPYFGQCIHSPPPPVNQTILVKLDKQNAIPLDQIYNAFTISGKIKIDNQETEIGEAGYSIKADTVKVVNQ